MRRLNYPGGLVDPNVSVCGVRIKLELQPESVNYMKDKRVLFDMGAWLPRSSTMTSELPYPTFPVVLTALEPDRWLLQVHPGGYIRFDHGLDKIMGTILLTYSKYLLLPGLSNVDFSKCYVEVDIVKMSMSGKEQHHTLAVVRFQPQKYGQTCEYHPTHVDFRPLAAHTRHLNHAAPSALKDQRGFWRSILHGAGGTRTVLSKRPDPTIVEHAIARRTTRDAGKQRTARAVSRQQAHPFSNSPAGDVVPGQNLGSGAVPGPVAAHLGQRADPKGGSAPPLQPPKPGRTRVSAGGQLRHSTGHGGRLARGHGSECTQQRRCPRINGGLERARFSKVDLSQRRILRLSIGLAGSLVGLPRL